MEAIAPVVDEWTPKRTLKLRTALGVTQAELADCIGLSGRHSTVSAWERGLSQPMALVERQLRRMETLVKDNLSIRVAKLSEGDYQYEILKPGTVAPLGAGRAPDASTAVKQGGEVLTALRLERVLSVL